MQAQTGMGEVEVCNNFWHLLLSCFSLIRFTLSCLGFFYLVHTHMTNTRITDPEIMERRYPVILREFSLRRGSGGKGHFQGGEGVVREVHFS